MQILSVCDTILPHTSTCQWREIVYWWLASDIFLLKGPYEKKGKKIHYFALKRQSQNINNRKWSEPSRFGAKIDRFIQLRCLLLIHRRWVTVAVFSRRRRSSTRAKTSRHSPRSRCQCAPWETHFLDVLVLFSRKLYLSSFCLLAVEARPK